jgi:hypothetical protein
MSTKVYCNLYTAAYDVEAPKLWATVKWFLQRNDAQTHARHYGITNFHQYIKSLYCHMHHIIQICHLAIFLIPKTEMCIERPSPCWHSGHSENHDKIALQHSIKCFPGLLQRPPETLKAVYWCRTKIFWRRFSAPECKDTMLIFIPSLLELSRHRL